MTSPKPKYIASLRRVIRIGHACRIVPAKWDKNKDRFVQSRTWFHKLAPFTTIISVSGIVGYTYFVYTPKSAADSVFVIFAYIAAFSCVLAVLWLAWKLDLLALTNGIFALDKEQGKQINLL